MKPNNIKPRKSIRFKELDVLEFIRRETTRREISENTFVNECVKKCMDKKKYESDLGELKELIKDNNQLLKTINNTVEYNYNISKENRELINELAQNNFNRINDNGSNSANYSNGNNSEMQNNYVERIEPYIDDDPLF